MTEEVGGEVEVAVAFGRRRWRRSGGFRARASARGGADERGGYGGDLKWWLGRGGGGVRASAVAALQWVSGEGEGTGRCGRARGVRWWVRTTMRWS